MFVDDCEVCCCKWKKNEIFVVLFVGYINVGKFIMMNGLVCVYSEIVEK